MRALLRRIVGYEGPLKLPLIRIPSDFAKMEKVQPGDEVGIGWERGVLVVAPLKRERLVLELLDVLRGDDPADEVASAGGAP